MTYTLSIPDGKKIVAVTLLVTALFWGAHLATAAVDANASQQQLQQQLKQIQQQISAYQQQLLTAKGQAKSLANAIAQLQAQQKSIDLQIQATNLQIAELEGRAADTTASIARNESIITTLKLELSSVLQQIQRHDLEPDWYRLLAVTDATDLSADMTAYAELSDGLNGMIDQVTAFRKQLATQQQALADEREVVDNLLSIKQLQQQDLIEAVGAQNTLLKKTKGRESEYQSAITDSKKQVAEIQSRIYQLLEVSKQINFAQAAAIAQWASQQTGVRAALLLAVLSQESSLGANVGTCNRAGDPPSKSWRVIMKPDRDQQPFQTVTTELGLKIDTTPVSCPMRDKNGKQVGWGGAMGPAQFIPSTWMGYRAQVARTVGKSSASPWDIRDAFVAAGLLLRHNGADGTRTGEWNAAMRYFSGTTNAAYRFYGDSVMSRADGYQSDLDQLANAKK